MTIFRCIAIMLALLAAQELRAQEVANSDGPATAASDSQNTSCSRESVDSPENPIGNLRDGAQVNANTVSVRFAGPKGVTIGWEARDGKAQVWAENQLTVPNHFDFEAGYTY